MYITGTSQLAEPNINADRRIEMNIRTKSAALAVAAAALAAPVLLATAGTAHATPAPVWESNGTLSLRYYDAPNGLNAWIKDNDNPDGVTELCHYDSTGQGLNALLPFNGVTLLNGHDSRSIFIPGHPHNASWNVTVHCDGTGQTLNFGVFY
jgi:hypothetical protein